MVVTVGGPENLPSPLYLVFVSSDAPKCEGGRARASSLALLNPELTTRKVGRLHSFPSGFISSAALMTRRKRTGGSSFLPGRTGYIHCRTHGFVQNP